MTNVLSLAKGGVADPMTVKAINMALHKLEGDENQSALELAYIKASATLSGMTHMFNEQSKDIDTLNRYSLLDIDGIMVTYIANIVRSSYDEEGHVVSFFDAIKKNGSLSL